MRRSGKLGFAEATRWFAIGVMAAIVCLSLPIAAAETEQVATTQANCVVEVTLTTVSVLEKSLETDVVAGVEARSDAEAGIILRFHDPDNYLVALYSPLFKTIFLHDRRNGQWGANLGEVPVPTIGPNIRLTAAACGAYAAMTITDGTNTLHTPIVQVRNLTPGRSGLWLYQIGNQQEFGNFQLSRSHFAPPQLTRAVQTQHTIWTDEYRAPALPSPQDWILVLERVKP